jgi:hypothetical protein
VHEENRAEAGVPLSRGRLPRAGDRLGPHRSALPPAPRADRKGAAPRRRTGRRARIGLGPAEGVRSGGRPLREAAEGGGRSSPTLRNSRRAASSLCCAADRSCRTSPSNRGRAPRSTCLTRPRIPLIGPLVQPKSRWKMGRHAGDHAVICPPMRERRHRPLGRACFDVPRGCGLQDAETRSARRSEGIFSPRRPSPEAQVRPGLLQVDETTTRHWEPHGAGIQGRSLRRLLDLLADTPDVPRR